MDYPLTDASITEDYVDYVVNVPAIGDPLGIVSGTTRMPKDPIALKIADLAAQAIDASGLLKDGFSFQTGAGRRFAGRCRIPQANHAAQEHQGQLWRWAASRAISSECWKPDALPRFRTCSALT